MKIKLNKGTFIDTIYLFPTPVLWWDIYNETEYNISIDFYIFKWYIGLEIIKE